MRMSILFGNLWCVCTDKGGGRVEPVRIFFGQRGGFSFRDFVRTSFYGRPLRIFVICVFDILKFLLIIKN